MSDRFRGVACALSAAVLFGGSSPFAKLLLGQTDPVLMAGMLYLGAAVSLGIFWFIRRALHAKEAPLQRCDLPWLSGAIACGGILGPVLLMQGLALTPASSSALLLNLEGVFTALLAWFVFKENFDTRILSGMAAIIAGSPLLGWAGRPESGPPWGAIAIAGACLAWAADNNLTRKISGSDPVQIAALKGLVAGTVNVTIAWLIGTAAPQANTVAGTAVVGCFGYGVSLALFVLALRYLGTARTGAYFSVAPFAGVAISYILLDEHLTVTFLVAAVFMGIGVILHLTERHEHAHRHGPLEHEHAHVHDQHHQHVHRAKSLQQREHTHQHRHEEAMHIHPYYPDLHHRHAH